MSGFDRNVFCCRLCGEMTSIQNLHELIILHPHSENGIRYEVCQDCAGECLDWIEQKQRETWDEVDS